MKRSCCYLLLITLFSGLTSVSVAQMMMPDYVCSGETKHYYVEDNPGSVYIWRIDGNIQQGHSSNEFIYTWNSVGTYLLDVQEIVSDGCAGPIRSGLVYVSSLGNKGLIIHAAFSPNGDLINDYWELGNTGLFPGMEVTICNRWGQSVWKSGRGYPVPWDGRSNGRELPVDSYHYIIDLHDGSRPVIGTVTIVR